jgi:hypothetical protein
MSSRMNSLVSKVTGEARAADEVPGQRPHRRWSWRTALLTILVLVGLAVGLRYAVRTVPWVGPAGADLLRRLIGRDAVTRLEEFSAVAEDRLRRRSAIGLDANRSVLFVAITNDTTATALAVAMLHAGASDVAQLDVNWSYPKFVMFPRETDGAPYAQSLFDGFLAGRDDFVRKRSSRDFFYVVVQPERSAP